MIIVGMLVVVVVLLVVAGGMVVGRRGGLGVMLRCRIYRLLVVGGRRSGRC